MFSESVDYSCTPVRETMRDIGRQDPVGSAIDDLRDLGEMVTGADGSGFDLARSAGHRITDLQPSLVPFEMEETWCRELMGLSLKNISIRVKSGRKLVFEGFQPSLALALVGSPQRFTTSVGR